MLTWTLDGVVLPVNQRREAEGARLTRDTGSLERLPGKRSLDIDGSRSKLKAINLTESIRNHLIAEEQRLGVGRVVGEVPLYLKRRAG